MCTGESHDRRIFIVRHGEIVWTYDDPAGKGEFSDAVMLSNGNILFAHQFGVSIISPDKQVIWDYDAPAGKEIHTAVPIGTDHVLFVINRDLPVVRVVKIVSGITEREFALPAKHPISVHGQFRHVRLTANAQLTSANLGAARAQPLARNLVQPEGKGEMMERRLAARIPVVLFTIDLKTGKVTALLHSTDWIGHMLFSPVDPTLLMYCHEGPWQKVDRIWMIHTDGTHNQLIHKRTMAMEIAGHEFWGLDGKTIWYDWQYPKGEDFYLAGYNLETHKRTAYHMQRNEWSIHFNLTEGETLFAGDGGDPGQVAKAPDGEWIELFHPQMMSVGPGALNDQDFWQPGILRSEHLVNMAHHNYRLEPNVRFSPDKKLVIFTSNMFGPSYVFAVEVAKTQNPATSDIQSTPELARKFNPDNPSPTH
jgi:hypothetical protein